MNLLAFDLSLRCTGWAAYGPLGITYGSETFIKAEKGKDPGVRYKKFHEWLCLMLNEHAPATVVYEEPHLAFAAAIYGNVPLVALLQMECALRGIPYSKVHTQHLKKAATGSGNAKKSDMKKRACELFSHYDPATDGGADNDKGGDMADALLLMHITVKGLG